ncbi:hypothetical protein [Sporosarcina highlanderae]|uniref:Copper amine oxidase-like N-terminal domain-containing protein n=1 Tax=Sporosarcina highlanderae TaxID=3035916 RepID=A0ABT8JRZ7_9BACL|nr:hypothetical protein [Sporosarcina highlanderae]MDN4607573.1 hypothetical protein [Sporosarcina highlanderae]
MKIVLRTVILLLIINFSLIYMHYSQMADANGKTEEEMTYLEEIEVINRTDELVVRHHFLNLNTNRHEIVWPDESEDVGCLKEADSSCSRINESVTAILEGEQDRQSITYKIPKSDPMAMNRIWRKPFVTLKNQTPETTILHITDETGIDGMWISGLNFVGNKKTETIDYSLYKGNGQVTNLYWQQKSLPFAYRGSNLSVLGESINEKVATQLNDSLLELNADHIVVAVDPNGESFQLDRILLTQHDLPGIVSPVLDIGVRSLYFFPEGEQITADLIVSILIDEPIGNSRSMEAFGMLRKSLTKGQLEALKTNLINLRGSNMDAAALDNLVGEVSGLRTSFVQKNRESSYPLLFEEKRIIYINDKAQEGLRVIVLNNRTLYPASEVLSQSGYTLSANDKSIYIENGTEKIRFSLRDPFYVLNEKRYTLRDSLFELIDNEYYFEEDALRRLFHLSVQKNHEAIYITTLTEGGI